MSWFIVHVQGYDEELASHLNTLTHFTVCVAITGLQWIIIFSPHVHCMQQHERLKVYINWLEKSNDHIW